MTTTSTKPEALLWIDVETTGPDPYADRHEGRHRVEDCITRDIHDYRHYLETIQLKDGGK